MSVRLSFVAASLFAVLPALAGAQEPVSDSRLEALEAQVRALEARVSADGRGLNISTDAFSFRFNALIHADARWWVGDAVPQSEDSFLLRRLRPTFQGTVGKLVAYRLTPEFADGNASIIDAYVDLRFSPAATLRVGKVKGPVGLERLQGGAALTFIERGLPTELAPNREVGLQLQGTLAERRLQYVVGVYNGSRDGSNAGTSDDDGRKEVALRLFYEPVPGVGLGIAGSHGSKYGQAPRNYATVDRRTAISFAPGTQYDGDATRISPQAYVYRGPAGLLAEYIQSRQALVNGASRADVTHAAWQVVGSWVLTGESASFRGVRPQRPFQPGESGWGAVELAARVGALDLDDDSLRYGFIAANGVESVRNVGVGVNWYLNGHVKLALNYNQSRFNNAGGADRDDEKSIFTRLQVAF